MNRKLLLECVFVCLIWRHAPPCRPKCALKTPNETRSAYLKSSFEPRCTRTRPSGCRQILLENVSVHHQRCEIVRINIVTIVESKRGGLITILEWIKLSEERKDGIDLDRQSSFLPWCLRQWRAAMKCRHCRRGQILLASVISVHRTNRFHAS